MPCSPVSDFQFVPVNIRFFWFSRTALIKPGWPTVKPSLPRPMQRRGELPACFQVAIRGRFQKKSANVISPGSEEALPVAK